MNIFLCCLGKSQPEEPIFPPTRPSTPEKEVTFTEMMKTEKPTTVALNILIGNQDGKTKN